MILVSLGQQTGLYHVLWCKLGDKMNINQTDIFYTYIDKIY